MEPNSNRGEADRWVGIAEKLLTARDLIGSKTFAIRARESDPNLESAHQILAIADTLISGEVRINNHPDWYAVLHLVRHTHDLEIVSNQFRRLAFLLHPEKNRLPFADQAFKLILDAWSVLSDPSKKTLYDNELSMHDSAGLTQRQQQPPFWKTPPRNSISDKKVTNPPDSNASTEESFWTACPYCYNLYEYARVYEECTLRCQNCRRAFHAVTIPSPLKRETGKDANFYCWAYFPLGFSAKDAVNEKSKMGSGNWTPFSQMFSCPMQPQNGAQFNPIVPVGGNHTKPLNPRPKAIYKDDDDEEMMGGSDPSEDSDFDWGTPNKKPKKKKQVKNVKGRKTPTSKNSKKKTATQIEEVKKGNQDVMEQVFGIDYENFEAGSVMEDDLSEVAGTSTSRKQLGKRGNDMGKLDLNVEFSNEVEETAPSGMNMGNRIGGTTGEDNNIEGIEFFEGLDEFLSSLPILSVVGGDKGKGPQ